MRTPRVKHRKRHRRRHIIGGRRHAINRRKPPSDYVGHDRRPNRHRRELLDPTQVATRHKAHRPTHRHATPKAAHETQSRTHTHTHIDTDAHTAPELT